MFDKSGHRRQEFMRPNPALDAVRNIDRIFKGIIKAVYFRDYVSNGVKCQQTFVDIQLVGLTLPEIKKVPVAGRKANLKNGEDWAPEKNDMVLVQFINGNVFQPIVTGYLYPADVEMQGLTADMTEVPEGVSHYFLRCNQTTVEIDKDGNRTVYVAKDETLTVKGHGTITVQEGNLAINVSAGTASINVHGNATVHSDGNLTASATGTATVTGATVAVNSDGNINITGNGNITGVAASVSLTSEGGSCTVGGGSMNVFSSGNVAVSATGAVSISGTNIAISDQ